MAERTSEVVGADELRPLLGQFASGVVVVTTVSSGIAHALTATAFSAVSLVPPLVLVCVSKTSRFHAAVLAARSWAVSVLAAEQEDVARRFAVKGRELLSQFEGVAHRPAPTTGAPLLLGALAWLDCRTVAEHDAGDHTIVVGQVVAAGGKSSPSDPLTYYRGTYRTLR